MVISFSYMGQPYQVLPGRNALAGIYFVVRSLSSELTLLECSRWPALELHAQGQSTGSQHFLDFIE
jgi:hypothetical protein